MTTTANWTTTILRRRDVNYCHPVWAPVGSNEIIEKKNKTVRPKSPGECGVWYLCGGSFLTTNRSGASGGRSVKYYCNYYLYF